MADKKLVETSTLSIGVILVVVLFGVVNYFGWKYHDRMDWTETEIYSLSEKSRSVVEGLARDVEAVVFMSPSDPLFDPVTELLARYEAASPRLSVRVVDPDRNLAEAQSLVERYQVSDLNVVVFGSGTDRRIVETADLADYDYSGMQMGQPPTMSGFKGEQEFTSTLLELTESVKLRVVFTAGHGEIDPDDFSPAGLSLAKELLARDNFEVDRWASLGEPSVPEGTDLLVVAGPKANFVQPELDAIEAYLDAGGRMLALIDPVLSPTGPGLVDTGLGDLLTGFGVVLNDDIVIDPANPLPFFGAETLFVGSYGRHPITAPLDQAELPVILPLARSVSAGELPVGFQAVELFETSDEGWGETDLDALQAVQHDDADLAGPVPLAVAVFATAGEDGDDGAGAGIEDGSAAEPGGEEPVAIDPAAPVTRPTRLVVVGDSDFATNSQMQNTASQVLWTGVLNWLVERESLVAIPAKTPEQVRLSLDSRQMSRIAWLVLAGLPGAAIGLGLLVHSRRRK